VYTTDNGNYKTYHVYLNNSWITDNEDINPSGFVVLDSKWPTGETVTYKTYNGENTVRIPINKEYSYLPDQFRFSSTYDLANPGTYEQYINNTCYKKQVENFEKLYRTDDINYIPRKATL
jgi:hypothetical protein